MKRIVLFLATNIAVLIVLSIVTSVLGVNRWFTEQGLNYQALLIFSAIFGFGGAFISLAISKRMAKWTTGAQVISQPSGATEAWLLNTVQRHAQAAGIGMPEVAVFDSPDPNAFATGANRNNALVAVSTGLLRNMNQDQVEAVIGHEITHVANGDMVTLTLIQGVVNTFVIFLARVVGYAIDQAMRRDDRDRGIGFGYYVSVMVLEILFGILASMIVAWFSRQREFRADAGGAHLAGRGKMVSALERLRAARDIPNQLPQQMTAFGIRGGQLAKMFSTHPPLEERIARLQTAA
jgi:heat shock protein HtpX